MTINTNIFDLTIDIKARGLNNRDRNNQKDTFAFLNTISIYAQEAAKYNRSIGADASATQADEFSDLLYQLLKDAGYYKH